MKVAVFWTGGKDSYSAYEKVLDEGHKVACLVTFTGDKPFLCHPIECMELQAEALGIPYVKSKVGEPYLQGYRSALEGLIEDYQVEGIVTGDMAPTDHGDWIGDVCSGMGVEILRPLWGIDRRRQLDGVVRSGIKAVMTCVLKKWFDQSWLGRRIDDRCLVELGAYSTKYGIDACGEGGEYHTMVVDSPRFDRRIEIEWHEDGETDTLRYMKVERFSLKPKE